MPFVLFVFEAWRSHAQKNTFTAHTASALCPCIVVRTVLQNIFGFLSPDRWNYKYCNRTSPARRKDIRLHDATVRQSNSKKKHVSPPIGAVCLDHNLLWIYALHMCYWVYALFALWPPVIWVGLPHWVGAWNVTLCSYFCQFSIAASLYLH